MWLPFALLTVRADSTIDMRSEDILMEVSSSINNLKLWHSHSEPVAPLSTQNKMNDTVHEVKQNRFQCRMKETPYLP